MVAGEAGRSRLESGGSLYRWLLTIGSYTFLIITTVERESKLFLGVWQYQPLFHPASVLERRRR